MKYVQPRPFADPEAAARKLMEIANATEAVQDGRIHIEQVNGPFLYTERGSPAEYGAGIERAIAKGWLCGMNPGPTSNSPTPTPSYSPDMAATGWKRPIDDPIPLPTAANSLLSRTLLTTS